MRAWAKAAAKLTCWRITEVIQARASASEREPSVRHCLCAADDAAWSMRIPTSREPPAAVLPKTRPHTGGKDSKICTAVGCPTGACPPLDA